MWRCIRGSERCFLLASARPSFTRLGVWRAALSEQEIPGSATLFARETTWRRGYSPFAAQKTLLPLAPAHEWALLITLAATIPFSPISSDARGVPSRRLR